MSKKKKIKIGDKEYNEIETMTVRFNLKRKDHLEAFMYVKQPSVNFNGGTIEYWHQQAKGININSGKIQNIEIVEIEEEVQKPQQQVVAPPPPVQTQPEPTVEVIDRESPKTEVQNEKPRKSRSRFRI